VNILHRHLFKQLLAAAAFAVGLFVMVLVAGNLIREVIDKLAGGQLGWSTFTYLVALLVPGVIPYALPLGMLTAVLLVVGRLSAQSEYTAMRAAGFSLWTVAAPVLAVSCLGVALCLFINFFYAPAADLATRDTLASLVRNHPLEFFQPGVFVRDFKGYVFYVGGREGSELRDLWIWQLDAAGNAVSFARAQRGQVEFDFEHKTLVVTGENGVAQELRSSKPGDFRDAAEPTGTFPEKAQYTVSLEGFFGAEGGRKKLGDMTLPELLQSRIDGPPEPANASPEKIKKDREIWTTRVRMQIQRHSAGAFAVLALALLGIPLGLTASRSETFANLGLALGLALIYYLLLFLISLLENTPALRPDLLLWLPNFLYEGLGLALLYRAAQR